MGPHQIVKKALDKFEENKKYTFSLFVCSDEFAEFYGSKVFRVFKDLGCKCEARKSDRSIVLFDIITIKFYLTESRVKGRRLEHVLLESEGYETDTINMLRRNSMEFEQVQFNVD